MNLLSQQSNQLNVEICWLVELKIYLISKSLIKFFSFIPSENKRIVIRIWMLEDTTVISVGAIESLFISS